MLLQRVPTSAPDTWPWSAMLHVTDLAGSQAPWKVMSEGQWRELIPQQIRARGQRELVYHGV